MNAELKIDKIKYEHKTTHKKTNDAAKIDSIENCKENNFQDATD